MNKTNLLYFLIGILFVAVLLLSINAVTNSGGARYEHAIGQNTVTILDTETGKVKLYFVSPKGTKYMGEVDYSKN